MCTSPSEANGGHCSSTSGRSVVFILAAARRGQCKFAHACAATRHGPDVRASGERDAGAGSAGWAGGAFALKFVESPNGELMVVVDGNDWLCGMTTLRICTPPHLRAATFVGLLEGAEIADNKQTLLGWVLLSPRSCSHCSSTRCSHPAFSSKQHDSIH